MANVTFKGFKQVSLEAYNALTDAEKKHYMWLVRELENGVPVSSAIYFGTRKYAEVNDDSASAEKFDNLLASLGELVDENGEFLGFLPVDEHELLASAGTFSEAFSILEAAVLANADEIAGKVSQDEYEAKMAELDGSIANLEEKIEGLSGDVISAMTEQVEELAEKVEEKADKADLENVEGKVDELGQKAEELEQKADELEESLSAVTSMLDEKANADDVYTKDEVYSKDEVDAKVAGVFHFTDNAVSISADETTLTLENGDEIVASDENNGDVYQIGDAEYASNGTKWVKLGFNQDMSNFATKDFVNSAITTEEAAREELEEKVSNVEEALAQEIQAREELADEVKDVKDASTVTAATFSDAEEMDLNLGQIVYVTTAEENSGITYTPGAYIYTQDGLKKLDSTTPSTSTTLEDRVESLENRAGAVETKLGNEAFEGESVTAAIAALQADESHIIDGDDVEE